MLVNPTGYISNSVVDGITSANGPATMTSSRKSHTDGACNNTMSTPKIRRNRAPAGDRRAPGTVPRLFPMLASIEPTCTGRPGPTCLSEPANVLDRAGGYRGPWTRRSPAFDTDRGGVHARRSVYGHPHGPGRQASGPRCHRRAGALHHVRRGPARGTRPAPVFRTCVPRGVERPADPSSRQRRGATARRAGDRRRARFTVFLREGWPATVLNAVRQGPEVCTVFCAITDAVEIVLVGTRLGRSIIGVVEAVGGAPQHGVQTAADQDGRRALACGIGHEA